MLLPHQLGSFGADGGVTESRAFRAARDNANVSGHEISSDAWDLANLAQPTVFLNSFVDRPATAAAATAFTAR
jgi:hypothetical protein